MPGGGDKGQQGAQRAGEGVSTLQAWLRTLQNNPAAALESVSHMEGSSASSNFSGKSMNQLKQILQRIATDYISTGTLTAETKAALKGITAGGLIGDKTDDKGIKEMAMRRMLGELRGWANTQQAWDPSTQNPTTLEGIGPANIYGKPEGTSVEDFTQQFITNQMLQYLDPESRKETMLYLSRANPALFRKYELAGKVNLGQPNQTLDPAALKGNLATALAQLDMGTLTKSLPGFLRGGTGGMLSPNVGSGVNWMKDYLSTAMSGLGGTRADQLAAAARLGTLEQEAQGKPQELGQLLTLVENMTNPIFKNGPLSGLLGRRRGILQGNDVLKKGLVKKNLSLL